MRDDLLEIPLFLRRQENMTEEEKAKARAMSEPTGSGNSDVVTMPRSLTAENGAKALLMGEFYSEVVQECPECEGDGWEDEESGEECHECAGAGTYTMRVPVSWTTIKAIYAMAVEHLAS